MPGSDGAGTVIAVGSHVTRFKPGDKVLTLFNQEHIAGPPTDVVMATGLGGIIDGTFRSVGAFHEQGLVMMPSNLSAVEASTLSCAGLTAWNALYGSSDHKLAPGQWVLTQGTGGVSLFAVQFAKAAGAKVIATTGSNEKSVTLRNLGADYVLNYKEQPDWGGVVRNITGGRGVDHVLEVGGPETIRQSIEAIKAGGVISIIGSVGGTKIEDKASFMECLSGRFTARGIVVGSRQQLEAMCMAIEANPERLKPVLDSRLFSLEQIKDAYDYMWSGKHCGKNLHQNRLADVY